MDTAARPLRDKVRLNKGKLKVNKVNKVRTKVQGQLDLDQRGSREEDIR